MKALVVAGTRPEAIKLAPVIAACAPVMDVAVCATGQHRDMLGPAFDAFGIVPGFALDPLPDERSLNALAAHLVAGLDGILDAAAPDWVIVQGDTASAFCGALAAFHRGIRVAHVEAGLRTGNLQSPFPEEAYRAMLARIATLNFAPTPRARDNLIAEAVPADRVLVTGNTVVDALAALRARAPLSEADLPPGLDPARPRVLVTCHRRENFGPVLAGICAAIARLAARYPDRDFVFPVHPNPNIRLPVAGALGAAPNVRLIDPLPYRAALALIAGAELVLTDFGGIQEEAPSFSVPCVVMRAHTERPEGVEAGFATLAGQHPDAIAAAAAAWLNDPRRRATLGARPNPYGDGNAALRIRDALVGAPA